MTLIACNVPTAYQFYYSWFDWVANPWSFLQIEPQINFRVHFVYILSSWATAPVVGYLKLINGDESIEFFAAESRLQD